MTPRERFIAALERKPLTGRVPHFELVFFLTMEEFGRVAPQQRHYAQWDQMEKKEQELHLRDVADIHVKIAERFEHSGILLHPNPGEEKEMLRQVDLVREISGDRYFLSIHGDATYGIPSGDGMLDFSYRMADDPQGLKKEAAVKVDQALEKAERLRKHGGLDGFCLCADYCLNTGPFMSPNQFSEFVTPYLDRLIRGYRDMGFYVIKHTDGNIMPILDQLVQTNPHALHSLDPQGGVDIAEVKRLVGDKACLIGNVSCSALDTGTDEDCVQSARYALKHGMPGYGYIFSTSNCIYTGMRLERYKLILDIWRTEGNYPG